MRLSTVVSVETGVDPNALTHYNQLNSATFQAVPMPGVSMGQAVEFLQGEAKKLPSGFSYDFLADSRQYVHEGNQLAGHLRLRASSSSSWCWRRSSRACAIRS